MAKGVCSHEGSRVTELFCSYAAQPAGHGESEVWGTLALLDVTLHRVMQLYLDLPENGRSERFYLVSDSRWLARFLVIVDQGRLRRCGKWLRARR